MGIMFTGIITEIGKVKSKTGAILILYAPNTSSQLSAGDSISVNGVCLTVIQSKPPAFTVNLLEETAKLTNLGRLKTEEPVNLELPLKAGDKINGHIVAGHIDGTGRLARRYKKGSDYVIEIDAPRNITKYIIHKGSVAIDGVSLTIVKASGNRFTVHLIPYTLKYTTLGKKEINSVLNIEIDILARYAQIKS